jgi:hypothetical protein
MKVLIWIVSFVVFSLVTAIANIVLLLFGIQLGRPFGWLFDFIMGFVIPASIARSLCKKWSNFRAVPIPQDVLEEASQYRGKPEAFAAFMKSCIRTGRLTKKQAKGLYKELSKTDFLKQ